MKFATISTRISLILIFPVMLLAQGPDKYRLLSSSGVRDFVSELADHGKREFRLVKVIGTPNESRSFASMNLVGVLERDIGQQYEYDWFEAYSPSELETKINERARSGFHFKEAIPFAENYCGIVSATTVRPGAAPIERADAILTDVLNRADAVSAISYGAIFIVERKIGNNEAKNYKVAADTISADTFSLKGTSEELLKHQLDIVIRDGFRPVTMMPLRHLNRTSAVVLLENDPQPNKAKLEAIVTRSGFEKKVDRLAKNGYRMLFSAGNGLERYALMEQDKGHVSYRWVDLNSKKEFGSRSDTVFREGDFQAAVYDIQRCDPVTTHLVFKTDLGSAVRGTETILLALQVAAPTANPQKNDPLRITDETLTKLKELSGQGFKVRDMFYLRRVHLIMER